MLGPHWIRCTTKGVHTASQTKATAIYVLSELRFSCPHCKDVRSHREGTYTPSRVYQRKTTTIVMSFGKTSFDTRTLIGRSVFRNSSRGLTFCDLRRTCPHYRLAVCDAVHSVVWQFQRFNRRIFKISQDFDL